MSSACCHYDGVVRPTRARIIITPFLVLVLIMTATDPSLEALDPAYVADVLSRPPFVQISGVCNVRDLGSYPTTTPNLITKPGYAFRGAEISHITEHGISASILSSQASWHLLMSVILGIQQMRALGITTVFDLRSDPEMQKYSTPIPTIEGVHILRTPVFKNEDYSPESMARCVGVDRLRSSLTLVR